MALTLYIHWPFCARKCPYCDFNSHVRGEVDQDAWREALLADLAYEAALSEGAELGSIFFGGGTPSLMPPATVAALIDAAAKHWRFAEDIEITLEANPLSVEVANFAALARAGVKRVSLGLQALDDDALRFLGRLHDVSEGLAALDVAQSVFERVSFDLIYAIPGQTPEAWRAELERALSFGTDHLSIYQLTIEPGTRFATLVREDKLHPLADDPAADLFALTRELTAAAGLPAYEVSNHARPGEESRHNLAYWRYRDYLGVGPGAHGRRNGVATLRHKKPENWLAAVERLGHGIADERMLGAAEQATEALLMGLRLREGVDLAEIGSRFGFAPAELVDANKVWLHRRLGLIEQNGDGLIVTPAGMPLLDALLADIVAPELVGA